jgi:hypothetical protein
VTNTYDNTVSVIQEVPSPTPTPTDTFTPTPTPTATRTPIPRPSSGSFLYLDSEPGDFIGRGQQRLFTADDSEIGAQLYYDDGYNHVISTLRANVLLSSGDSWWVEVAAPPGQPLVPGTYEGAVRAMSRAPGQAGLDVSGEGRGCNSVSGRFVVEDAVWAWGPQGLVQRFDATFEQHCEGLAPALFGEIRIENEIPPTATATPAPTFTPVPHTPTPTHRPSIGGKVMLPPAAIAAESRGSAQEPGWSAGAYAALAVGLSAAFAALGIGGWYAKRRWQK